MRIIILLCFLSFALACNTSRSASGTAQSPPPKAEERSPASPSYTARGNEPFWNVSIDGQAIVFRALGQEAVTYPYHPARNTGKQKIFESQAEGSRIRITFAEESCMDSMSGERFAYTVTMEKDGKVFKGCGK